MSDNTQFYEEQNIKNIFICIKAIKNILIEMQKKNIETMRLSKTASFLVMSGVTSNSIFSFVKERCLSEQNSDGGWISIVDTVWNLKFLSLIDKTKFSEHIEKGNRFIFSKLNKDNLWGRHSRDISRIPVTGLIFFLFPELANLERLCTLEKLWYKEYLSITYKAGFILCAFGKTNYQPTVPNMIEETVGWLIDQQREDGGFAPWKNHVVDSDVYCTSIAMLGLIHYFKIVPLKVYKKAYDWLISNQLPSGLWKYHQIEDGSSWGLYTLTKLREILFSEQSPTNISPT